MNHSAEYALRAVVWIASQDSPKFSTSEIARYTRVPAGYLSKILQMLGRAGIVQSNPGRAGGFQLTRSADQISVLEVVNAVEAVERIRRCPLGIKQHKDELCPLHRRLDQVAEMVERAYAETTIAEIVHQSPPARALCHPQ